MKRTSGLALVLLLVAAVLNRAPGQEGKTDDKKEAPTGQTFVTQASAAGLAEVNLSRLAAERATRPEVKKFARQLLDEHTKANAELNKLADSKRLTPAPRMDAKHQAAFGQLAKLTGADFDQEYLSAMVKDHEEAIDLFERMSKDGTDKDLQALATKLLPTLKEHLEMARKLADKDKDKEKDKDKDK
jgi:putative membrane protein